MTRNDIILLSKIIALKPRSVMLLLNQTYYRVPVSNYIFVFFMMKMGEIKKRLDKASKKQGRALPQFIKIYL